jgi:hypothetical protein
VIFNVETAQKRKDRTVRHGAFREQTPGDDGG